MENNLATNVARIHMPNIFMNASGVHCTEKNELINLAQSSSGAMISKSCTLNPREGNPEPRYWGTRGFSINSMGIPNHGYQYYTSLRPHLKEISEKPYFMSVSGMTWEENRTILSELGDSTQNGPDLVEFNVSCPNIVGKPQLGYDFEGLSETIRKISELWTSSERPLGLKLPPYFDMNHFDQVADIILEYSPTVQFVTCCNSFGNGLYIDSDDESVVIRPKKGFGGVGGCALKPTSLANTRKFYTLFSEKVDVIGCGGIQTGKDAFDYILCGAKAVQIGTQLKETGLGLFDNVIRELSEYMKSKGYNNIEDFRGKLKESPKKNSPMEMLDW